MLNFLDAIKRIIIGTPYRTENQSETLLKKRLALPIFASDAISSVGYAPDEIILTLSLAGVAALTISPWVGLAVIVVLLTVVASYRQNVYAYPNGGGGYEIASQNLGKNFGLTVASSLMVDYILTVAVSMSSAIGYFITAFPFLHGLQVPLTVGGILLLMILNLRGMSETGFIFAIPSYVFMISVIIMAFTGWYQYFTGHLHSAESAGYQIIPDSSYAQGLYGLGGALLILRSFSSGASALTGVEAISNGVPVFKTPKSKNAAATLLMLGSIAAFMIFGIMSMAELTKVRLVENPATQLLVNGQHVSHSFLQHPVLSQISAAVFGKSSIMFYVIVGAAGAILLLASNTAFNGMPVLASILARDHYLPRQLRNRGDRLTYSNSIILLALVASLLVIIFHASVTGLMGLYIIGVFISFTISQIGMVVHWTRELKNTTDSAARKRIKISRVINFFGSLMTGVVFLIVLVTKFTHGAWMALLAMAFLFFTMKSVHNHYVAVAEELKLEDGIIKFENPRNHPVHAIVLVGQLRKHTLRALAYAKATEPQVLEAVVVDFDEDETQRVVNEWENRKIPVKLTVLESPYREITRPTLQYVKKIQKENPGVLVVVYIPEYVVGHWYEQLLHNQTALKIKSRLHYMPRVIVSSVPWQLESSDHKKALKEMIKVSAPKK
ncbi:MAG: APC family permease [Micrococcaceae bacterium]